MTEPIIRDAGVAAHPAGGVLTHRLLSLSYDHAALKHENRHDDYLKGWWSVVNWHEAARRFARADRSAVVRLETKGAPPMAAAIRV
jgi:hypothetical protein